MSGHDANLIFFNKKKIKIGHPEDSLTLQPLCLTLPTPSQSGRHMYITPLLGKLIRIIQLKYLHTI